MKHTAPKTTLCVGLVVAATALFSACSEKPQTAVSHAADSEPWKGSVQKAFDAPGWTPGDKASWEAEIKQRNRSQNEYVRMGN